MTNPSRKRVVTSDDLDTLNRNSAYARQQGEIAAAAAERATAATVPVLSGTQAQRRAYDRTKIKVKTRWDVTEAPYATYWFTPGDSVWRDSSGNDPDYVPPTPPPDTGEI